MRKASVRFTSYGGGMRLRKLVANNVKARRLQLDLTQEQVAKRARLNTQHVSRIERAPQNLTLDAIESLAKALETTPSLLLADPGKNVTVDVSDELREAARAVIAVAEKLSPHK